MIWAFKQMTWRSVRIYRMPAIWRLAVIDYLSLSFLSARYRQKTFSMLVRSMSLLALLLGFISVVFVQSERAHQVLAHSSKAKFPSILDEEASQWLSTRNVPRRWHHQHPSQVSSEIDQTLKQLQAVNDNGIRQFDTQSFEGVSMEVIFEMVYKQQNSAASG